jgi:3-hydroxybutyryl-CoA dehydrogenase
MNNERIGVVGAGIMGSGIAQVCALAGLPVTLVDISGAALERAMVSIGGSLDRQV